MRPILRAALVALVVAIPARGGDSPATCRLIRAGTVPMEMDATGRINVPVTFNGVEKWIMVDTGAAGSLITAETATELTLKAETRLNNGGFVGWGGEIHDTAVTIKSFGIAGITGKDFTFFVMNDNMDSAGLLGGDIFRSFDVDLDFANAKLALFSADHCPGQVVYWTRQAYGAVPFEIRGNHIWAKVQVDGKEVAAILDTGAADTVMSLDMAAHAYDLDQQALRKSRHYPFKTLSLGAIAVANPAIELVPDAESGLMGRYDPNPNMIVGMGVLRRLHLYISYKEKMIYVTPATQY